MAELLPPLDEQRQIIEMKAAQARREAFEHELNGKMNEAALRFAEKAEKGQLETLIRQCKRKAEVLRAQVARLEQELAALPEPVPEGGDEGEEDGSE